MCHKTAFMLPVTTRWTWHPVFINFVIWWISMYMCRTHAHFLLFSFLTLFPFAFVFSLCCRLIPSLFLPSNFFQSAFFWSLVNTDRFQWRSRWHSWWKVDCCCWSDWQISRGMANTNSHSWHLTDSWWPGGWWLSRSSSFHIFNILPALLLLVLLGIHKHLSYSVHICSVSYTHLTLPTIYSV